MAETLIQWCDRVWNFLRGCSLISAGCQHCYAMLQAHRFDYPAGITEAFDDEEGHHEARPYPAGAYEGLTEMGPNGPRWNGRVRVVEEKLREPAKVKKPQKWFVNSMSDLFHEDVPFDVIDRAVSMMAWTPQHTYQILTKRPDRMLEYSRGLADLSPASRALRIVRSMYKGHPAEDLVNRTIESAPVSDFPWPLPNVWFGVSCEDQKAADARIPLLLQTPAAVRFVSYEPALGPINFTRLRPPQSTWYDSLEGREHCGPSVSSGHPKLAWIIIGGESGNKARPFDPAWALSVIQQCKAANISCFVKQMGSNAQVRNDQVADIWFYADGSDMDTEGLDGDSYRYQGMPVRLKLKDSHGGDMQEWPAPLRVREFPTVTTAKASAAFS